MYIYIYLIQNLEEGKKQQAIQFRSKIDSVLPLEEEYCRINPGIGSPFPKTAIAGQNLLFFSLKCSIYLDST
jgi:hypothetical protein